MATRVILCLGSNTNDRRQRIIAACQWLASVMTIEAQSDIYDTPPFSGVGSDYVNTVVAISTDLTLETIDALCKEYERREGRDDTCRSRGIVPIDMDVVIYGDTIVRPHEVSRYYFQQGYCSLKD